jgi:hypothetical protein
LPWKTRILEWDTGANELLGVNISWSSSMPAILLWLLGVPLPIIILLLLLWH